MMIKQVVVRGLVKMVGGLEMEEAENGQEAVDYFRRGGTCDLVLMDKDMPIMDGHEVSLSCLIASSVQFFLSSIHYVSDAL